jgi:hypothetical protein
LRDEEWPEAQFMVDISDWKPTAPYRFGAAPPHAGDPGDAGSQASPKTIRLQAISLLLQRGYVYVGEDSVGLPCFRSRSGAMLIGVGSCRCLAYAKVDGRLQVVAAARTLALLCRIAPEQPGPTPTGPVRRAGSGFLESSLRPESVLVI